MTGVSGANRVHLYCLMPNHFTCWWRRYWGISQFMLCRRATGIQPWHGKRGYVFRTVHGETGGGDRYLLVSRYLHLSRKTKANVGKTLEEKAGRCGRCGSSYQSTSGMRRGIDDTGRWRGRCANRGRRRAAYRWFVEAGLAETTELAERFRGRPSAWPGIHRGVKGRYHRMLAERETEGGSVRKRNVADGGTLGQCAAGWGSGGRICGGAAAGGCAAWRRNAD